jgi:hypothetical protein
MEVRHAWRGKLPQMFRRTLRHRGFAALSFIASNRLDVVRCRIRKACG